MCDSKINWVATKGDEVSVSSGSKEIIKACFEWCDDEVRQRISDFLEDDTIGELKLEFKTLSVTLSR